MSLKTVKTSTLIKRLIASAIAENHVKYASIYRALFFRGSSAVPDLESHLLKQEYVSVTHSNIYTFTPIFMLLHEIDEERAAIIATDIIVKTESDALKSEIRRIQSKKNSAHNSKTIAGVNVHFSSGLRHPKFVEKRVRRWLNSIPADHLAHLETAFIVNQDECGSECQGYYEHTFGRIVVGWLCDYGPHHIITLLFGELLHPITLFHEVGHHVLGHTAGPTDSRKEEAANQYKSRMLIGNSLSLRIMRLFITRIPVFFYRLIKRKTWQKKLSSYWLPVFENQNSSDGKSSLDSFELKHKTKLPKAMKQLLSSWNGMPEFVTCPEGFYFFPVSSLEVRQVQSLEFDRVVVFARHVPTDTEYCLPLGKKKYANMVYRNRCHTASGYLKVSNTYVNFIRQYVDNLAILTC